MGEEKWVRRIERGEMGENLEGKMGEEKLK